MKTIFFFLTSLLFSILTQAQADFYTKKGLAIEGYDVTEYFNGKAIKGNTLYSTTYKNSKFLFVTNENKQKFEMMPQKYVPQYGGYCAYAIGRKSKKVKINPKSFQVREGKLYLFYNSLILNTLNLWNKEGAANLQTKADENWIQLNTKK